MATAPATATRPRMLMLVHACMLTASCAAAFRTAADVHVWTHKQSMFTGCTTMPSHCHEEWVLRSSPSGHLLGRPSSRRAAVQMVEPKEKLKKEARALSFSFGTLRLGLYAVVGLAALAGLTSAVPEALEAAEDARAQAVTGIEVSEGKTRAMPLEQLLSGARQTVVLLGGPPSWLRDCLFGARLYADLFRSGDVLVVPVELEEMESEVGASKTTSRASGKGGKAKNKGSGKGGGKGFGASAWSKAPYVATVATEDAGAWASRLRAEAAAAAAQGADADAGVVIVLGAGGQVTQRRVGMPEWRPFLMQLAPSTFDKAEVRRAGRAP